MQLTRVPQVPTDGVCIRRKRRVGGCGVWYEKCIIIIYQMLFYLYYAPYITYMRHNMPYIMAINLFIYILLLLLYILHIWFEPGFINH